MSAWVRGHSNSCQETPSSPSKECVACGVAAEALAGDSGVAGRLFFSLGSFLQNGGPRAVVPPSLCTSSTTLPGRRGPFFATVAPDRPHSPQLLTPKAPSSCRLSRTAAIHKHSWLCTIRHSLVFILCFKQPPIHGSVKQTSSIWGPSKGLYQIAR